MKLTILGKYGPYPQDSNSACSGYLVEQDNVKLLIDCGSGVLGRLKSLIDMKDLTAVYLTHLHFDHTSDLLPFRYLLDDLNVKLNVYTHLTGSDYEKILLTHPRFIVHDINGNSSVDIGNLNLTFYKLDHPVVNHGVLIKGDVNLGITGDTKYCDNVLNLAVKSNYLLADCSKPVGFKGPHMTAAHAKELSAKTNATILATHVTPNKSTDHLFDGVKIIPVEELKTYELKKS